MCSTFKYMHLMGRNYDYEQSYDEQVINIPKETINNEYAMIGIGSGLFQEYPLLYDAMNSQGLCMSSLAFQGNAKYFAFDKSKLNIPVWNVIPYILGHCKTVKEFKNGFTGAYDLNITDTPYNDKTPNTDLHWFLCDKKESVVIESTIDGLKIYDNPYNTMTNNPPFNEQMSNYNTVNSTVGLIMFPYSDEWESRGRNTDGLSGGYSSNERFERLTYLMQHLKEHSKSTPVLDALKLCDSVEQLYGLTPVGDKYEYTIYKSVYNMDSLTLQTRKYNQICPKQWVMEQSDEISRWQL